MDTRDEFEMMDGGREEREFVSKGSAIFRGPGMVAFRFRVSGYIRICDEFYLQVSGGESFTTGDSVGSWEPAPKRSKRFCRSNLYSSSLYAQCYIIIFNTRCYTYPSKPSAFDAASSFNRWASVTLRKSASEAQGEQTRNETYVARSVLLR